MLPILFSLFDIFLLMAPLSFLTFPDFVSLQIGTGWI
jgi:hypothetical protein